MRGHAVKACNTCSRELTARISSHDFVTLTATRTNALKVTTALPFEAAMSSTSGIGQAQNVALGGIRAEFARFNKAATDVVRIGAEANNASVVEISDAAREAASNAIGGDLEGALVDTKVASAGLTADVKVLQTANDMNKELMNLLGKR